jgi:GH15 family glucan-1,4-alpha-glucosidase
MTLQALLFSGFRDEAAAWREWLLRAIAGDPADLRIMYGLAGERRIPEWEVGWLDGYAGSRPVRVGNAASDQFQLDVYGEVLDALHLDRVAGLSPVGDAWSAQRGLLDILESRWEEPDLGLWEMRGEPRHFVHSKVMAWAGFDRAVKGVESFGLDGPVDRWRALRDQVHREVCDRGYDAELGSFTQAYGSKTLDASTLLIPHVGFLPGDDDRVRGTVDAVKRHLTHDGFVLRYDNDESRDGLSGDEGAFIACTLWLADGLHLAQRDEEAREVFNRVVGLCNDVGLLAEEFDPRLGRQMGNVPQAYSHIALINTARYLSRTGQASIRDHADDPQHRGDLGAR